MRIAIVNDMAAAVEALRRVIAGVPRYRLAWVARDGAEAVERCKQDTPDLILMDLMMPVMDGAEATRRIMAGTPCAILVVTASVAGHCSQVFEALGAGALDAVQTPVLAGGGQPGGAASLKFKIDAIGRLILEDKRSQAFWQAIQTAPARDSAANAGLVVIGASAGGPAALATILGGLPRDFPAAIVVVQHLDARFAPSMASWLNEKSELAVRLTCEGDRPEPGAALIAASDDHLVFFGPHTMGYTTEPHDCYYRPSVDVFFESVVRHWKGEVAGVLLTGMGRDGARGLKALRQAGFLTIAQDAASCVVYGMPKAAAELDAVVEFLPVDRIAGRLMHFLTVKKRKVCAQIQSGGQAPR